MLGWGCSSAWLERFPVKKEVGGSSPLSPALTFLNDPELVEGEIRNLTARRQDAEGKFFDFTDFIDFLTFDF